MNPIVRSWRCSALCWSCGDEVPLQAATRGEVERPMRWYCPACDVRWFAYADRVEAPAAVFVPNLDRDLVESGSRLLRGSADALA